MDDWVRLYEARLIVSDYLLMLVVVVDVGDRVMSCNLNVSLDCSKIEMISSRRITRVVMEGYVSARAPLTPLPVQRPQSGFNPATSAFFLAPRPLLAVSFLEVHARQQASLYPW